MHTLWIQEANGKNTELACNKVVPWKVEVLVRNRGNAGEVVSWNESESNVREEVLRRNAKAGYCTRNGEPTGATKIMTSVSWGRTKLNVWPRDPVTGELID